MGKLHGFRVEVKYKPLIKLMPADYAEEPLAAEEKYKPLIKLMPADYADVTFVGMININEQSPRILSSKAIIRFQDCDPYAHLNNGRYLDYFMNCREDQLWKEYDFNIYEYSRTTGLGWVVTQNQVAYIRPALLMEEVTVESQLIEIKGKFVKVEMRMYDAGRKLKSLLWAQFLHVDIRQGKSAPHSEELQQLFETVCVPVEEKDFNERLKVLNY